MNFFFVWALLNFGIPQSYAFELPPNDLACSIQSVNTAARCHATLLPGGWILTSNHCAEDWDSFRVNCGGNIQFTEPVTKMPNYTLNFPKNDLALLPLKMPFASAAPEISILPADVDFDRESCAYFANGEFRPVPSQWVRNETLEKLALAKNLDEFETDSSEPFVNFHYTKIDQYISINGATSVIFNPIEAVALELPRPGDSGGPVLCKTSQLSNQWFLVGVQSKVYFDFRGFASVNLQEPHTVRWLNKIMNSDQKPTAYSR